MCHGVLVRYCTYYQALGLVPACAPVFVASFCCTVRLLFFACARRVCTFVTGSACCASEFAIAYACARVCVFAIVSATPVCDCVCIRDALCTVGARAQRYTLLSATAYCVYACIITYAYVRVFPHSYDGAVRGLDSCAYVFCSLVCFACLFILLFACWLVRSVVRTFVRSFVCSLDYLLINHSFILFFYPLNKHLIPRRQH